MMGFGTRLAQARKNSGLTQRDVASNLDVCTASVSNWESGNNFPALEMIPHLCRVLRIDPNYLFGHTESEEADEHFLPLSQLRTMEGLPVYLKVFWGEEEEYDFSGWGVIQKVRDGGMTIQFNGRCHFLMDAWYANPSNAIMWRAYRQ